MYDYNNIRKQLKSLDNPDEKKEFIEKVLLDIKLSESADFSDVPSSRFEHITKRIDYLEKIFILRNLLIESYFDETQ